MKGTHLKFFLGIQMALATPNKATWRSMNPYSSPNFLHIFTTLMQDCSESTAPQGKKIRFLHTFAETKTLPTVQVSSVRLCNFDLILTFVVLSWGWHHADSSAEKVCSRRLKAGILCVLFTLFMLEPTPVHLPYFSF